MTIPILDVRTADDTHAVGVWGNTIIQIWRGAPTEGPASEVNRLARQLIASAFGPVTSLYIVEKTSPPPNDQVRKLFAEFSRDIVSRMSLAVVVAEGGGFRSALVRGVGLTLTRFLPHRSAFEFVNSLEVGVQMLQPHLPAASGGKVKLLAATEELRARIGSGRPVRAPRAAI